MISFVNGRIVCPFYLAVIGSHFCLKRVENKVEKMIDQSDVFLLSTHYKNVLTKVLIPDYSALKGLTKYKET